MCTLACVSGHQRICGTACVGKHPKDKVVSEVMVEAKGIRDGGVTVTWKKE